MSRPNELSNEELSILCEQICLILRGGLPMHDGVEALCENYKGTRYEPYFTRLNEAVLNSGSLSDGFQAAGVFPSYMVEMTRIGEKTGELDGVMDGLADYYENEARKRRSVRNAIFYPLLLIVMMALLIGVLMIWVLPVFDDVFASFAGTSATSAWMNLAMGVGKTVLILAGALILLALLVLVALRLDRTDRIKETLMRLLPPLQRMNRKLHAARFASTLSMMLRSGYPLDESMKLIRELFTDRELRGKLDACVADIENGGSFPEAAERLSLFDPLHSRMIRVGFKAGQTDQVMKKLADLYAEELDTQISRLVSIIEPTLVALMSLILGAILLSVMLPLLSVMGSIG